MSSTAFEPPASTLPPELPLQLEALCTRFQADWQAGHRPRLEDFLLQVGPSARAVLLDRLLALEVAHRCRLGEQPSADDYHRRLPEYAAVISEAFAPFASTRPEGPPTPTPGDAEETPGLRPAPPAPPLIRRAGRYEIEGEIAHGGMGAVLRARDLELNRPLAIKVLRADYRGSAALERRFREEAQITGQLQHPGIPPVHEVGTLPDGRPFFAMKLIQGRTLAQLLQERTSAAHDLPRFVAIFEQVCQTLAYAHSQGVIHRDLKPHNIMVGAFGEVQVMDWGLAKQLRSAQCGVRIDPPGPKDEQTAFDDPSFNPQSAIRNPQWTAVGDVLGTPAYMAPEQARGEIDQLDERCDVFGLGAILCVLLTGQPPYRGARSELRAQATQGDLTDALQRLADCGADPELIQLAWACLTPDREMRLRDAGVVAQAVAAYLAGVQERVREAEQQRAVAEARAVEERKRRRLAVALTGAVLLLVLVGGSAAWWFQQQRAAAQARRDAAGQKTQQALERGRSLLEQGWRAQDLGKLREAHAEAERAVEAAQGGEAAEALRRQAADFHKDAAERLSRAAKNRDLLDALLNVWAPQEIGKYARDAKGRMMALAQPSADQQYMAAFRSWGLDLERLPEKDILARLSQEPEPVLHEILAALDRWVMHRLRHKRPRADWARLVRLAGELDRSALRRELRGLMAGERPAADERIATGLTEGLLPWTRLGALARGPDWRRLLALRSRVDPVREPVLSIALLATVCQERGDEAGAEELLRRAVNVRRSEVVLLHALGELLEKSRPPRLAQAIECYRAACGLRPRLGVALGKALCEAGRGAEGEAVLRDLIRQQPDNPRLHADLGYALGIQGKMVEAESVFRKALRLRPDEPEVLANLGTALALQRKPHEGALYLNKALRLQPDLPLALTNLGLIWANEGKLTEAVAMYEKALRRQPDYHQAHYNLSAALAAQGKLAEAVTACRQAIRLDPDYAPTHYNLGNALGKLGRLREAETAFREAIRLRPDDPGAHTNLGIVLSDQGKVAEAVTAYRVAIRLRPDSPEAHNNLGIALTRQGRAAEAVAAFQEALRLKPDYSLALSNLGLALADQGKLAEAMAAHRKALQLKPDSPRAHYNLGLALFRQRRLPEAEAAYREALRLNADYPDAYNNLGHVLADQRKTAEAVAAYREALRLKPDFARAHYNLANALHDQGDLAAAVAALRQAIRLKPDYPEAHTNLGAALASQGDLDGAVALFQQAIRLKPDRAMPYYNLGLLLFRQGKLAEAGAAYQQAIRLQPDYPEAHFNLGSVLEDQGEFHKALESLRTAHRLGIRRPDWPAARSTAAIRQVERLIELDSQLAAFLAGKRKPAGPGEQMELAALCGHRAKRLFVTSTKFYAEAFAGKTALADDLTAGHRYNAACMAALAGCGRGEDAARLDDSERARLRRQALDWLRADLAAWGKKLETDRAAVLRVLARWGQDPNLSCIRAAEELMRLPEAEREAWRTFWGEVAALRRRGQAK
jgi:serine/threonine-protein kinase